MKMIRWTFMLLIAALMMSSCSTYRGANDTGKGAIIGGGSGAAAGGLIGGAKGAIIGGAVGAGAGAVIGNEKQKRKDERRRAREANNPNL
ncbi:YMGG-like glycine zipper-containing protein [Hymenobacter aerophilus]|uniref:YMGG-like glycine zipper-containing protein n=1 Tax=Hymenobacter aerophilus TaxID=119644 RepID=UPI00037B69DE|nr:YMGG-like glycine zipper-containing protein [Hymenobacter aerophilus]